MPYISDPSVWLKEFLINSGLNSGLSAFLSMVALVIIVVFLSWLSNLIAKAVIRYVVENIVKRTTSIWDDIFVEQKVFSRLSHLAPALVIWFMAGWALKDYPTWLSIVQKLTYVYMLIAGTVVISSFINAWHAIYNTLPVSQHRHIKGYVQLVKIIIYTITLLIIISVVFKKDISTIVAGLGAMAAVLLLIFKDTILGLVASIQLSGNEMLKVGDWITIPGRAVDGTVMDITLNTVKVQNFDRSIITVPTYALVNESFQNWKGMEESRGRQVKRSIPVDMRSIKFLDAGLIEKLGKNSLMKEYIESLKARSGKSAEQGFLFNSALPTNLGAFRYYAESFLKDNPLVDKGQVVILKHTAIDGNGLQLQISMFTSAWQSVPYENLQSEITENFIAVMNEFGLRIFQSPTGYDVLPLKNENNLKQQ